MKKKRMILIAAILFIIVTIMAIVLITMNDRASENDKNSFYTTGEEVFAIETDYCDLYYPLTWSEQIVIEFDKEDKYSVQFSAKMGKENVPLFDINFGGTKGDKLGTLETDTDKIDLYVVSHGFNEDDFTQDEYIDLCGMNEDLNVIISKLIEEYNFQIAQ